MSMSEREEKWAAVQQRAPLPDAQRRELAHDHLHDAVEVRPRGPKARVQLALPGRLAALQEGNRMRRINRHVQHPRLPSIAARTGERRWVICSNLPELSSRM